MDSDYSVDRSDPSALDPPIMTSSTVCHAHYIPNRLAGLLQLMLNSPAANI